MRHINKVYGNICLVMHLAGTCLQVEDHPMVIYACVLLLRNGQVNILCVIVECRKSTG